MNIDGEEIKIGKILWELPLPQHVQVSRPYILLQPIPAREKCHLLNTRSLRTMEASISRMLLSQRCLRKTEPKERNDRLGFFSPFSGPFLSRFCFGFFPFEFCSLLLRWCGKRSWCWRRDSYGFLCRWRSRWWRRR